MKSINEILDMVRNCQDETSDIKPLVVDYVEAFNGYQKDVLNYLAPGSEEKIGLAIIRQPYFGYSDRVN